ncbi:hypothetical protein P389DRAFT_65886 [Cystobasidium minutum MCA 4210]|uniref:uncharacterized protein n=1 Tax=Cystobasidium minutum MCA 4210 TaxID=1397322 RepID=UPI0034CE81A4|eukprot:jgi/Rhomi1/65886/CE65885_2729
MTSIAASLSGNSPQPSTSSSRNSTPQPTILRIRRRKRDDHETLDALFVDDGRQSNRPVKRSKASGTADDHAIAPPSKGVFRFLETVPTSAFSSEASKRSLRERVTSLLLHPPPRQSSSSSLNSQKSPRAPIPGKSAPGSSLLLGTGRQSKLSAPSSPASSRASTSNLLEIQEKARRHARYKIVQEKRSISTLTGDRSRKLYEDFPPLVRSTAKSASTGSSAAQDDIRILEATVDTDSDVGEEAPDPIAQKLEAYSRRTRRREVLPNSSTIVSSSTFSRGTDTPSSTGATKEEDDIMMNFVPMLQEYLSLNRPSTPEPPTPPDGRNDVSPPHPGFGSAHDLSSGDAPDSDSEWVYDVYYRDVDSAAAISGSHEGVDIGGAAGFERIAALTGLNEDEILLGEGEGGEDSDVPNTDDEDSNEEDFYRNDYPEGDEDDSDEEAGSDMSQSEEDEY